MSLPDRMSDRWQNRPEPAPGEGAVSWHMLMRDYPEVVNLARQAQQRLAGFDGLHMTPLQWLHITTLLAGPAADFSPDKLRQMTETATDLLASTPPAAVTLGQVLYHPEAITVGVTPAETLTGIYNAARSATHQVTGEHAPEGTPRAGDRTSLSATAHLASPPSPSLKRSARSCLDATLTYVHSASSSSTAPNAPGNWSVVSTIRLATSARA
jgi:hypothetical protein